MRSLTLRDRSGSRDGQPAALGASLPTAVSTSGSTIDNLISPRHDAGAILSLGALGIAAAATVIVFFGIGLSLLIEHPSPTSQSQLATATVDRRPSVSPPPVKPEAKPPTSPDSTSAPSAKALEPAPQARSEPPRAAPPAPTAALPESVANPAAPPPIIGEPAAPPESVANPATPPHPPVAAASPPTPARETAAAQPMAATPAPAPAAPAAHDAPAARERATAPLLTISELNTLLAQGDAAFRDGDLTSARLYYLRAFGAGDGRGALGIGASYDPVYLRRFHLWTQRPDPAEARAWYIRAHDLGATEADGRLDRLRSKLPP